MGTGVSAGGKEVHPMGSREPGGVYIGGAGGAGKVENHKYRLVGQGGRDYVGVFSLRGNNLAASALLNS